MAIKSNNKNAAPTKAPKPVNYESMDKESLKLVVEQANLALAEKILAETAGLRTDYIAVVNRIDNAMAPYGLSAQDFLTLPKAKLRRAIVARLRGETRQPLAPRYVHPEHSTLTWSGRGSRPKWLRDLLEKGHELEEYRVRR